MKNISLSVQVHQCFRFKKYRFFDVGNDPYYFDDFENERIIRRAAENLYLPANEILIKLLLKYQGFFKVAISISGTAIDQFYLYAPEVLESFQSMADTGGVEFLGETYSHSLASLFDKDEFMKQSRAHSEKIGELFNQIPSVYRNTELIYSDEIGEMVAQMGFKSVLTEGGKQLPKGTSPNYLYQHPNKTLKILLNNSELCEDLSNAFANLRKQANYNNYISTLSKQEQIINLCFDFENLAAGVQKYSGILMPSVNRLTNYNFMTPSVISDHYAPVAALSVQEPIFKEDKNSFSARNDNELQEEALRKLYSVNEKIKNCKNADLLRNWRYLQSFDHLYYMSSKFFSNKGKFDKTNPYNNPYEAFLNYMNILDDFELRLNHAAKKIRGRFTYTKSSELVERLKV